MTEFVYTIKGQKKFIQLLKNSGKKFLAGVHRRWRNDGGKLIRDINAEQLSGRPGLKKRSGEASRALNYTTRIVDNDVIQRFFIPESSPAKTYLPIHDKSYRGGPIKHPGGTPYIVTDKGARWLKKDGKYPRGVKFTKPHDITIPKRTNIIETLVKEGKKLRTQSVNAALKEAFA